MPLCFFFAFPGPLSRAYKIILLQPVYNLYVAFSGICCKIKITDVNRLDQLLLAFQRSIRKKPLLYRFTLGTRSVLAIGFIPTGLVKLMGYRFTSMSVESDLGAFFEVLYQSGLYWKFLGLTQVLAGVLILIPATSAVGALLFCAIMVNIFTITISYDFALTPIITFSMLLASIWLVLWDFHRFRGLIFKEQHLTGAQKSAVLNTHLPQPTLQNIYERIVYILGTAAGILFFGMLRGLILPTGFNFVLPAICLICFFAAVLFAVRYANIK